jgi:hypothetical protein
MLFTKAGCLRIGRGNLEDKSFFLLKKPFSFRVRKRQLIFQVGTEIPFAVRRLRRHHIKKIVSTTIGTGPHNYKARG